ncbi:MAG TPA: TetR/AcrR family transcriptional regulator [Dermatophilaceae bacterium]|jgi:AcrR family transcriptional regulator|nr:TetR/AcrR family transcriptional regulator [Dermatophilaceae bacterium]
MDGLDGERRGILFTMSRSPDPAADESAVIAAPRRRGRPGYDLDSLLATTVDVFIQKGFDGTSMEDLSQRLGISKSAIYHHVTSKNELLDIAVNRALDDLGEVMELNRRLTTNPVDRLEHLIRASVGVLVARKPFVTLLLRMRGNTDVERRALQRRKAFDQYCADLVAEGVAVGLVRPDIDPTITARLLFGMVNSLIDWARPQTEAEVMALSDAVWGLAFEGMHHPFHP